MLAMRGEGGGGRGLVDQLLVGKGTGAQCVVPPISSDISSSGMIHDDQPGCIDC
jgi:hypothetical protein